VQQQQAIFCSRALYTSGREEHCKQCGGGKQIVRKRLQLVQLLGGVNGEEKSHDSRAWSHKPTQCNAQHAISINHLHPSERQQLSVGGSSPS